MAPLFSNRFGSPHRVVKGDRLYLLFAGADPAAFSPAAYVVTTMTLGAFALIEYDDGSIGELGIATVAQASLTLDRSVQTLNSKDQARGSGTIVDALVTGNQAGIPRGALCTVLAVGAGTPQRVIGKGYTYNTHPVVMDEMGEWGPGGGNGYVRRVNLASTAVPAGGLVLAAVPTNAIWKDLTGSVRFLATATVGTRNVVFRFRDANGAQFMHNPIPTPIVNQSSRFTFGPGEVRGSVGLEPASSTDTQVPIPGIPLAELYDLFIDDTADIDVADTAVLEAQAMEWVSP